MAVENLVYQGINRAPTDYVGVQACEELINMRPTQGGLCPVRDFGVKWGNVDWEKVFVHHTSDGDKYIAVRKGSGRVWAELVESSPLFKFFDLTDLANNPDERQEILDNLHFAAAGNVALFSICAPGTNKYNFAYTWKDGAYVSMNGDIPNISLAINGGGAQMVTQEIPYFDNTETDANTIREYVENGISAIQEKNPDLCLGPIIIAAAFKTNTGQTFWTTGWQVYDPVPTANAYEPTDVNYYYVDDDTPGLEEYEDFFDKHGHGYTILYNTGPNKDVIKVVGTTVSLDVSVGNNWNADTSFIKSVEIYASKPVSYLDTAAVDEGYSTTLFSLILPQLGYDEMGLGGQLLYLQASIPMESIAGGTQTVHLTFGGNIQVTEDTLYADAGAVRRYGNVLSYNARFHFFNSVSTTKVEKPFFLTTPTGNTGSVYLLVRYEGADPELMYLGTTANSFDHGQPALAVVAGSLNVKEVITYFQSGVNYKAYVYRMEQSPSYNFSFGSAGTAQTRTSTTDIEEYRRAINAGAKSGVTQEEKTAINVSEQYNPFVFRVEHSYVAPAAVLDVQPQMASSVDNSYGTYPLNVFTERGLYALIQGSANVLYGAFDPLSSLVAKKGVPLEMGTFFLSAGNLWLVSGRRLTLVSDALSRGPNKHVRACPGYKRLSGDQDGEITPVYDVSRFVSAVTFEHFTEGGGLSYNRIREELYVSNPAYSYTYVISIKYRQWYKLSQYIRQDESGSSVAFVHRWDMTSGLNDVVDFNVETGGRPTVHMQTRPFSMAYSYSHVHRIVAMARAALSGIGGGTTSNPDPDLLVVALYGSDDLHTWKLLAYAKRNGTTSSSGNNLVDHVLHISQIRTPSSSRSWRYYTVCIGGKVPALADNQHETELGPILVDYEPVVRRIG